MNDYEIEEHIAFIMRKSRDDAGISRDTMAKRLNVSTKTIQNYEDGSSCPSIKTLIKWFQIIDVPLYPYILQINSNYLMEMYSI